MSQQTTTTQATTMPVTMRSVVEAESGCSGMLSANAGGATTSATSKAVNPAAHARADAAINIPRPRGGPVTLTL